MPEEAPNILANIVICSIYLFLHIIVYSRATTHISLPIFRPILCFLQELARVLWCLYGGAPWGESVRAGEPAAAPSTGSCRSGAAHRACRTTNSAKARLNTTSTTRKQDRKRKRREDDEKGPPEQMQKVDTGQNSSPFACPFYLYDRHQWHNCLRNYTLNRIVDVRLHLTRAHALPPQCPICGEEFTEDSARSGSADDRFDAHVQLQTCQPLSSPPPPRHDRGLTRDQFESVRIVGGRRNGRRATDPAAEKWFEIWDIIFPWRPRPVSPYINDHPDVQRIRDMNDDILAGEQWRDLTAPTRGSSPSLQNVSRSTIVTITERLLAFYRRRYPGPNRPATEGPAHTPVTGSTNDSLQQPWEVVSAPSQPSQPSQVTQDPVQSAPSATAAMGPDQWTFQQTHGYPASGGRSHDITVPQTNQPQMNQPQMNQSLYPFESDLSFFTATQDSGHIFSIEDGDDTFELTSRPGSPSQFLNDFGPSTSGYWGQS